MGSFFDNLTKTGVQDGNSAPKFYDHPADAGIAAAQHSVAPTYRTDTTAQSVEDNSAPFIAKQATPASTPKIAKPTFKEATQDASGMPRAINSSETKMGKLLHVLGAAAQGGLAGEAASERAVVESGGRRNGGFGLGVQAAQAAPFQRVAMQNNAQQEALQTKTQQQQYDMNNQPVTVNGVQMPWVQAQRVRQQDAADAALAHTRAQTRQANSTADKAEQDKAPNLQALYAQAVQAGDTVAAHKYADAIQSIQKETAPKLPNRDDKAIAIEQKRALGQPLTADEIAYDSAYKKWVKENKTDPGVMRAQMFVQGRPVQIVDPNNPDQVVYTTAGQAVQNKAVSPQSADFQAAKGVQKAFTSGKPAEELVAFNTAIAHADLLKQAADAMNNNDTRALNSIKNKLKTEFGFSDVTNFNVIANAYSREVTKALSAGHITDNEIKESGATIPQNAGPEQIMGAVQAYKNLMASKVQQRKAQYESGKKGKPNFGGNNPQPTANPHADIGFVPLQ